MSLVDLTQRRGFSGRWDVTLAGAGLAYDGTETATAKLWSATDRTAALATLAVSWVAPPDRLRVQIPAEAIEGLTPGLYLITVILRGDEEAAEGWLHVLPGIEP